MTQTRNFGKNALDLDYKTLGHDNNCVEYNLNPAWQKEVMAKKREMRTTDGWTDMVILVFPLNFATGK